MNDEIFTKVMLQIYAERKHQDIKHPGGDRLPDGTNKEIWTSLADQAKQKTDMATERKQVTWLDVMREEMLEAFAEVEWPDLRKEIIQIMAVGMRWIEDGDTRETTGRRAQ